MCSNSTSRRFAIATCGHRIGAMVDSCAMAKGHASRGDEGRTVRGALDLMVLQALDTMGPGTAEELG